jgi:hypothetical protein
VSIYDAQGKEVYAERMKACTGTYDHDFDFSSEKKGNYLIRITQGDRIASEKFVVE